MRSCPAIAVDSKCPDGMRHQQLATARPEDWRRWQPKITADYKTTPARMFASQMQSEGLRVTEKMVRDRLRQWNINNKNRRSGTYRDRRYVATVKPGQARADHQQHDRQAPNDTKDPSVPGLRDVFHPSKEARSLQQTLKGVLDWQVHFRSVEGKRDPVILDTAWLSAQLWEMDRAIMRFESGFSLYTSHLAIAELRIASIAFRNGLQATCTPMAVLMAIFTLSEFNTTQDETSWTLRGTTRRFILQVATETLPGSHPAMLLLRLLLCERTPDVLAAIYRMGCGIFGDHYGTESHEVFQFQLSVIYAAITVGMSTNFETRADVPGVEDDELCIAVPKGVDNLVYVNELLYLRFRQGRYDRSAKLAQVYLSALHVKGQANSKDAYQAWRYLSISQRSMYDTAGEEISLRNALKVAGAIDPDVNFAPGEFSFEVLQAIRELYRHYRKRNSAQQCEALRLEYPSVFQEWDTSSVT